MARKQHKKRRKSIQERMSILIFLLMSGTLVFSVLLGVDFLVQRAMNKGPLDITFEEYEREELALDASTENVLYEETEVKSEVEDNAATEGTETQSQGTDGTPEQEKAPSKYDLTDEVTIPETEYPYYVKVNRQANCVTVYTMNKKGKYKIPVKAMVCSVGRNNNTPIGVFQTSTKYTWRELFGNVFGQYAYRIHNSIMFHSVPYYSPNKDDLETEEYNKLGEAASLGCVRLSVADAKWLVENCPEGTTVEIYEDEDPGPLGRPDPITIDTKDERAGWDPTDPDQENPWHDAEVALTNEEIPLLPRRNQ